MKKKISFATLLLILFLTALSAISAQHKFYVDLNDRADDLFKVTLIPAKLTDENKIFQFAATAPGTYQIMDVGRYVKSFKAFDKDGKVITTVQSSVNQWEISNPTLVSKVVYEVAETWDTPMEKDPLYPMCGSSIENDFVVINGQCIFGYFHGMQKYPVEIKLEYPNDWLIGTALTQNNSGFYSSPDYDTVVDSPILLGKLTKASTKVSNTTVDVFTYSKKGLIKSENILTSLEDILSATDQFTQGLPVDRYVFLFSFEDFSAGAWEHNYSSFYVFKEDTLDEKYASELRSTAAHEFFHIITPLHIHSELVENFNYERPVMSQHLWLYEGVTEWASDIMQMRDYLVSLDDYLRQVQQKLNINDNYDQNLSLTQLGIETVDKQDQYFNIYNKGAIVACLLDIKLLELSKGKKGLREVLIDLLKQYGVNKSISEKNFFNDLSSMTYPEINDFINNYIAGAEKLPVKEYFAELGIDYVELAGFDSSRVEFGFGVGFSDNKFIVTNVDERNDNILIPGDVLYKFNGEEITLQNIQQKYRSILKLKAGEKLYLTVKRGEQEIPVSLIAQPREIKHVFKVMDNPTPEQLAFRNIWMQNIMSYKGNMEAR